MNRILVRTATVAFGALLSAGCATTNSASTAAPQASKTADAAPAVTPAASLATNLDTEIAHAREQRAKGDFMGASRTLTQLMLVAPDNADVVGEYGKVLAQRGKSDDAIAFLKRAVELNPTDWTLYSALGVAYDEENDRAHARAAYKQALALKPDEPVVLNNMAVSDMLAGDYASAKTLLQQAAAAGNAHPKIGYNLQKIAELEAAKPAAQPMKPATQAAKTAVTAPKPAPVPVAKLPAPDAHVVMQKVPEDPKAGPVADHDPRKLAKDAGQPEDKKPMGPPKLRTAAD